MVFSPVSLTGCYAAAEVFLDDFSALVDVDDSLGLLSLLLESLAPLGLGPAYRSEYQPPPLSRKLVALICFSTFLERHLGQVRTGGSDIFCHSSKWWLQAPQAYS